MGGYGGVWGGMGGYGGEVVINKINNLQSTVEPWRSAVEVSKIKGLQTTVEAVEGLSSTTLVLVANKANGLRHHSVPLRRTM
jgi:GTPase involved in cell partitioning and DNA repair